jgi:hypothetical protein
LDAPAAGPAGAVWEGALIVSPAAVGTLPDQYSRRFRLRCADVLDVVCDASWCSSDPMVLVTLAHDHGELVHGFTPSWYSPQRLALMRAAVTD